MLGAAARTRDWDHNMLHRCAWCSRVADADKVYRQVQTMPRASVATDGICPDCLVDLKQQLAARRLRKLTIA